jgi:hypothetical protein
VQRGKVLRRLVMANVVPLRSDLAFELEDTAWADVACLAELGKCLDPFVADQSHPDVIWRDEMASQIDRAINLYCRVGERINRIICAWANKPEHWPPEQFYIVEKDDDIVCRATLKFRGITLVLGGIDFVRCPSAPKEFKLCYVLEALRLVVNCPYRPLLRVA